RPLAPLPPPAPAADPAVVERLAAGLAAAPDLDRRLAAKAAARAADERARPLARYRQEELARMHAIFFDPEAPYHALRSAFVRKTPGGSPRPLAPVPGALR
ncbi:hydrogenase maturation protein, partial [Streptomyces tricolor]